jgi:hypothetical protein
VTQIVGQNVAIQAAIQHRYFQTMHAPKIIGPPLPPVTVVLVAYTVEGEPGWHLPGDHDDPVVLVTEGVVIGLFLVVVVVGFCAWVRYVRRPFSERLGEERATK